MQIAYTMTPDFTGTSRTGYNVQWSIVADDFQSNWRVTALPIRDNFGKIETQREMRRAFNLQLRRYRNEVRRIPSPDFEVIR